MTALPPVTTLDELAGRLDAGDLDLGTYTDEELLAVTPDVPDALRLMPLTTLAEADEATRATALRTAVRSLVARGLVAPVADEDGDSVEELEVSGTLALVLDVLARPSAVTLADREAEAQQEERVWYAVGSVAVLDHEPLPGGLHRFVLRRPDRAAGALAAFLDPHGWADRDGVVLVHRVDRAPPAGWERVDRATEQAQVSARVFATGRSGAASDEREALVAAQPSGVWLLSVDGADESVVVRAVEVSAASLLAAAAAMVVGRAS